jgi:hypothetical protein
MPAPKKKVRKARQSTLGQSTARAKRSAEATRIPAHGKGRLMTWEPGKSGNPGGRPATLREVQQLCRKKSVNAVHALIACFESPSGKILRNVDQRIVVQAVATLMKWGYGEPPPYDPSQEKPDTRIDITGLTLAERRMLLAAMDRATTVTSESTDTGPDFDPSRFEPEPITIEAEAQPVQAAEPGPMLEPAEIPPRGRLRLF